MIVPSVGRAFDVFVRAVGGQDFEVVADGGGADLLVVGIHFGLVEGFFAGEDEVGAHENFPIFFRAQGSRRKQSGA